MENNTGKKKDVHYVELLKFEDARKDETTQVFAFSNEEAELIGKTFGISSRIHREKMDMREYDEKRYRYIQDSEDGIPMLVDLENPLTALVEKLSEQLYTEDPESTATAKEIAEMCPSVKGLIGEGGTIGYKDLDEFISKTILEPHPECIREGMDCDVIYGTTLEFVQTDRLPETNQVHVFSKEGLKDMGLDTIEAIYDRFVDGETFVEIY